MNGRGIPCREESWESESYLNENTTKIEKMIYPHGSRNNRHEQSTEPRGCSLWFTPHPGAAINHHDDASSETITDRPSPGINYPSTSSDEMTNQPAVKEVVAEFQELLRAGIMEESIAS